MKWLINCLRCGHSWNVETQYVEKGLPPAQSVKCPNCHDDTFMYKKCELLNDSAQKQDKERTATSIPSTILLLQFKKKLKPGTK
jgi:predicted  nucleic acid-binding Zn-ribbon protein